VTKLAILAATGGLVILVAATLNFVLESPDEPDPKEKYSKTRAQISSQTNITVPNNDKLKNTNISTPSFDIVRITNQGNTVMAGRAAPDRKVTIYDGKNKIGEVLADTRGEWVFVPTTPLSAGSHRLSLQIANLDGTTITSGSDVILVVPDHGKDLAGKPTDTPPQPLAIKIHRNPNDGIEVLQKPYAGDITPITIDAVNYNDEGTLNIVGKANPGATINVYLSNNLLGHRKSNQRGLWNLNLNQKLMPGIYNIRADHVDKDGKVKARVEVVFAQSTTFTGLKPGTLIVVESGRSLWRIARKVYGKGLQYTVIYEANKNQIKDPNMIFPGQVFSLPPVHQ
jgi:hypothetical protein